MVKFSASLRLFVCHAVFLPRKIVYILIKIQVKPVRLIYFAKDR